MDNMLKTGLKLAGLTGILVLILSVSYILTKEDINKAKQDFEKRARKQVFAKTITISLDNLPTNVKFEGLLKTKIYYDNKTRTLNYIGDMSEKEKNLLINLSTNDDYQKAIKTIYDKAYSILFSEQIIYAIEKKGLGYKIFNEVIKPDNFALLSERKTIEFAVLNKDEKLQITNRNNLKPTPIIITQKQYTNLTNRFKLEKVKVISYHEAYEPSDKHALAGWVIKHYVTDGYSGNIGMLIGYDVKKKITGFLMVEHEETPGLGTKANDNEFVNAFKGKEPDKMPKTKEEFKPLIGIDSISGATITSLAVSKGINQAYIKLNIYSDKDMESLEKKVEEQKEKVEGQRKKAEKQRKRAEEQRKRAEEQRKRAEEQRKKAEKQRKRAEKQRKRAKEQRKRDLKRLKQILENQ